MILELDLGNTLAKWRVVGLGSEVTARGRGKITDWLDGRFPDEWRQGVGRVRVGSVLAPNTEAMLLAKLQSSLSLSIQLARSTSSCAGVTNAYAEPDRLGVDRWLALIAAYRLCGEAVMVVDAGTALKVDAVNNAGCHIGGYIIPGAALMGRALLEGTDRVRYEERAPLESAVLGWDTRSCVQHGITAALVGAVLIGIEQCQMAFGKRPHLYVTGGLGAILKQRLYEVGVVDLSFEADLVLDGLSWVLP